MSKHKLSTSTRMPMPGAVEIGNAAPTERLEVSVVVRRANALPKANTTQRLDHAAFAAQYGASDGDIQAVKTFAANCNLAVVSAEPARRTVVLSGTVADFNRAFDVDLKQYRHADCTYRGRVGDISIPDELNNIVEAVLGLDNRPQAKPHFRVHDDVRSRSSNAPSGAFAPTQLAELYQFPAGDGAGQCIGLIELGGGFRPADLSRYFAQINVPAPNVVAVSVDHGMNSPTQNANGPDGEVMLDIEVAGAIAPKAKIAVYFAPNTDAGFLDAITTAIHDTVNKPSVISISWGGAEPKWTAQTMTAIDQAFQSAAALGVTICVATGDNGSNDDAGQAGDFVDFPASSPHALACGGTSLFANGSSISSEVVWNDGNLGGATGGGISSFFSCPDWQNGLTAKLTGSAPQALTQRSIPDVCGDADPETGYKIRIDGANKTIGGTSAVAPLWAGLIARLNSITNSQIGFINPTLYANPNALRDVVSGNNGAFEATPDWDACTGLGSPNGNALSGVLTAKIASTNHKTPEPVPA